jgi:hypothetical protein
MTRVARRERRPASAVPTSARIIFRSAAFDSLMHGLIFADAMEPVRDLGYRREIAVTIAAVAVFGVGPSDVPAGR